MFLRKHLVGARIIHIENFDLERIICFSFETYNELNATMSKDAEVMKVSMKRIDDCTECQDMTMLKMDIEGAEYNALEGAKDTIVEKKPKLAICIYHSDEDMVRIPEWIHELVPEYKLYVRQHSNCFCETVLYATI